MALRRKRLKLKILGHFDSQRKFLDSLSNKNPALAVGESRLSKIITGHTNPSAEERRWFCWVLQTPAEELFNEEKG